MVHNGATIELLLESLLGESLILGGVIDKLDATIPLLLSEQQVVATLAYTSAQEEYLQAPLGALVSLGVSELNHLRDG